MQKTTVIMKKRLFIILLFIEMALFLITVKVMYLQIYKAEEYQKMAYEQQTRDRLISPKRGSICDRNAEELAVSETVGSVSVIHAQIKDEEKTAKILAEKLEMDYDTVLKKVQKRVALERIKTKVDKNTADEIRKMNIPGVAVDEDIKRIYPYKNLASQVIGFVGKDNQGIIGLEAKYEEYLKGEKGKIMTETDARGRKIDSGKEVRIPPTDGYNIITSIDATVQMFAEQTIEKAVEYKEAKRGTIIVMNPQNGEIYAMANKPDFDPNEPFKINKEELESVWSELGEKERNDALNKMWRNFAINDTYEPGSTFKVITSATGLESGNVNVGDTFDCGGGREVAGRYIKCWRSPRSHGTLTFAQGVQNSCNPVFMDIAQRVGSKTFYEYMLKFGFDKKTGIDLPGEAVGIMHKQDKIGPVELATMSFGQSFQITPLQLLRACSCVINGGNMITPHFATEARDDYGNTVKVFEYKKEENVISKETSETMKEILESVVAEGTGNKTYIPGYRLGGKTATSEKLPRRSGKYIASFMSFAPANDPKVIALVLIDEPQGACDII
ncbi:MAG: peptidoglycan glycosyltransferase [Firmicutes bacterium]|nr:peptidoglycan glycosyltransferase [Bacillota bacterium]